MPLSPLNSLRQKLLSLNLDGFLVPRADEHQGEYVPPHAERLAYLTGFTGSAGLAIALKDKAALFVDGRYTIQAKQEVDKKDFALLHITDDPPADWIAKNMKEGEKLGFDPLVWTAPALERIKQACEKKKIALVAAHPSPLDKSWQGRPDAMAAAIELQPVSHAGKSSAKKREEMASVLRREKLDHFILTQPDSICWLLNIRGSDVPYNPFALSFAVLHDDATLDLYIDPRKLNGEARKYFGNQISCQPVENFIPDLARLRGKKVGFDPIVTSLKIADALRDAGAHIKYLDDPCQLPKACKNAAEQEGMRKSHRRDGKAMVEFLYWLSAQKPAAMNEMKAADRLEEFRAEDKLFRGLSFPTIAGFGANGAIVHYRANAKTNKKFASSGIFLLDSGAQYQDGTTDITRTIAIGKPTAEQRDRFTRVLKGHIALATARFPEGTTGSQLDSLARQYLWEIGLDYDHGTGHGVGCYLSVHEGPQRISKIPNKVALMPGMVISNEPGYYKAGDYGIRIENLIMVRESKAKSGKGGKKFLEFETLTLAPIDRKLIDAKMLNAAERDWLNAYHARIYKELKGKLSPKAAAWLKKQTAKI